MARNFVVLRERTPAEWREEIAFLIIAGAYSALCYVVLFWSLWNLVGELLQRLG
jgi:hypothetical protein